MLSIVCHDFTYHRVPFSDIFHLFLIQAGEVLEEHIIEATCASTTSDQSVNFTLKVKSKDKLAERLIVFRCREEQAMCEHVFLSERFVLVRNNS